MGESRASKNLIPSMRQKKVKKKRRAKAKKLY